MPGYKNLAILSLSLVLLNACSGDTHYPQGNPETSTTVNAPGAPGASPTWAYAAKTGIGTAYEAYAEGGFDDTSPTGKVSRVWFSIAEGIVTETMYGLIHQAQIRDMQFFITGPGFVHEEKRDTDSTIEYLHTDTDGRPLSLAYRIINRDREGRYTIEKHLLTDPHHDTLLQRVIFTSHSDDITAHLVVDPHMANTGVGDRAWQAGDTWYASEGDVFMALRTNTAVEGTVGFAGSSGAPTQLRERGRITQRYPSTGNTPGNVRIALTLPTLSHETATWDFALGFGQSAAAAQEQARNSLQQGFDQAAADYLGSSETPGWRNYLESLEGLPAIAAQSQDGGKLAYASALVLKAQEDKTHAGALIASLSNPWGDIVPALESSTGYKAVWPRDFYQVAMAMLALGDSETPKVAFEYLQHIQAGPDIEGYEGTPGWFLQKTHVDGTLEWYAVQLDQTAMPLMLGWRLHREGILEKRELEHWYQQMLQPAADFLADGGDISLGWNKTRIAPPYTQQERWEEQEGYSPSTTAAIIAGLVSAAEIAETLDDHPRAAYYRQRADTYEQSLEASTFTTSGAFDQPPADGRYYLRITQSEDPNDRALLLPRNGQAALNESYVVDPGFLELVRYGVRAATHPAVRESLPEIDNTQLPHQWRVHYPLEINGKIALGWRRYGGDGYGETTGKGAGYGADGRMATDQRGRVWPFLTGERGHYELALALERGDPTPGRAASEHVRSMEAFANTGLMLPEQVWDGVGSNATYGYQPGEGTNSATPLAWTHAEYIKLLRSVSDGRVWDHYPRVSERYNQH